MHTFDRKTGTSRFEFIAPPDSEVFLAGDFNHWRPSSLRMTYVDGRWRLCLRLSAGRYRYAFQYRNSLFACGTAEVPLCFWRLTDGWLEQAIHSRTCAAHFWKWN